MTLIKLSTLSVKYESDGKTYVKCILHTALKINKRKLKLPPVECFARLKDNDKFDYTKGCKISLAKAERKAYKDLRKILDEEYERITELGNSLYNFVSKTNSMIEHNTEYIKKLADKEEIK